MTSFEPISMTLGTIGAALAAKLAAVGAAVGTTAAATGAATAGTAAAGTAAAAAGTAAGIGAGTAATGGLLASTGALLAPTTIGGVALGTTAAGSTAAGGGLLGALGLGGGIMGSTGALLPAASGLVPAAAGGITAGGLMTAASTAGTLMGAAGGLQQAEQQKQMGKLAEAGQGVAAANALRQGAQDSLQAIRARRMIQGRTEAQIGALGQVQSGSAADILADIGNQGAAEVERILSASSMTAQGFRMAGSDARASYNAAARQSRIGAFGTLISGGANTLYLRQATQPKPFRRPNLGTPGRNPLIAY